MAEQEKKFEEALSELEEIVKMLEHDETNLDKAMDLFEKGTCLAKLCSKKLNEAQKKISILVEKENKDMILEDFNCSLKNE
ncbi:MAG: exodeoxyribonuclease VII small subunit [bacterium]|nr:exodeoxyribonuclease VII small subunit [bacterium]